MRIMGNRINTYVEFKQVESAWRIAHDFDIIPLIGECCYNELCERLSGDGTSGQTPTDADRLLLKNIQHFAAWAIYIRILEAWPSTQITPAGFTQILPDDYIHVENSGRESMMAISAKYRNKYKIDFLNFIDSNENLYPCLPKKNKCKESAPLYMNFITSSK